MNLTCLFIKVEYLLMVTTIDPYWFLSLIASCRCTFSKTRIAISISTRQIFFLLELTVNFFKPAQVLFSLLLEITKKIIQICQSQKICLWHNKFAIKLVPLDYPYFYFGTFFDLLLSIKTHQIYLFISTYFG